LRRGRRQTRAPLLLLLSLVVVVVVAFKSETPGALLLSAGVGGYMASVSIYIYTHTHVDAVMQVHNILTNWPKCIHLERGYD
jgi:hypothetical protein